jgi:hypothetical protein
VSYKIVDDILEHSKSRGGSRMVLVVIGKHADHDGNGAFPSTETIAKQAGMGVRNVGYCLRDLQRLGELVIHAQPGRSNKYEIKLTPAKFAPPQSLHPCNGLQPPPQSLQTPLQPVADDPSSTLSSNGKRDHSRLNSNSNRIEESFLTFWQKYRKKKAKQKARKAWKHLNPDEALIARILADVDRLSASADWRDPSQYTFIPYPATYLNEKRWEDEPDPVVNHANGKVASPLPLNLDERRARAGAPQ